MTAPGRIRRVRRLSGVARMYLALETPTAPMQFGVLAILGGAALLDADGRLQLTDIRRRLADRLRTVPELRRVIHEPGWPAGGPLWIEAPDFRIDRHVDTVAMPPGPSDETALLAFSEDLIAPLLGRADPLWRLLFITGLPDGQVGALFVIHHALADGSTAMRLLRQLLTDQASDRSSPVAEPRHTPSDLVIDSARANVAALRGAMRPSAWRTVAGLARSFIAGWLAIRGEPPTSLNRVVGYARRTAVIRLDRPTARRIARSHGAGVDDVLLALISGGLRALLASRGEPVEALAPRVGIAVALPPSVRSRSGNDFGSYVVELPIAERDPSVRLTIIGDRRSRAKAAQSVSGVTAMRVWATRLPPIRSLMAHQRLINAMYTHLPGPPAALTVMGTPILDAIPLPPIGRNVGLTFVATSYAGGLSLTVRTDPDAFPDLGVALSAMTSDWETLIGASERALRLIEDAA